MVSTKFVSLVPQSCELVLCVPVWEGAEGKKGEGGGTQRNTEEHQHSLNLCSLCALFFLSWFLFRLPFFFSIFIPLTFFILFLLFFLFSCFHLRFPVLINLSFLFSFFLPFNFLTFSTLFLPIPFSFFPIFSLFLLLFFSPSAFLLFFPSFHHLFFLLLHSFPSSTLFHSS